MREGLVVTVGAQATNDPARTSRRSLLALGMVRLVGLSALSGAGGDRRGRSGTDARR